MAKRSLFCDAWLTRRYKRQLHTVWQSELRLDHVTHWLPERQTESERQKQTQTQTDRHRKTETDRDRDKETDSKSKGCLSASLSGSSLASSLLVASIEPVFKSLIKTWIIAVCSTHFLLPSHFCSGLIFDCWLVSSLSFCCFQVSIRALSWGASFNLRLCTAFPLNSLSYRCMEEEEW